MLMTLWLAIIFGNAAAQIPTFVVERVEVHAQFDSSYVLALANAILPPNRAVSQSDVDCLLNELRGSGLFEKIETKWIRKDGGIVRLSLHCTSKSRRNLFTISKFSLISLKDVDESQFLKRMAEKGVFIGTQLTQFTYDELNDSIDDSIQKSVGPDLASKYTGSAWVQFRNEGRAGVEVQIFPERPICHLLADAKVRT